MNEMGSMRVDSTKVSDLLGGLIEESSTPWAGLLGEGVSMAYTDVTSSAGGSRFQSWRPFPGRPQGQNAIAEVRWQSAKQTMGFRFGVGFSPGGRAEREAAWKLATTLEGATRADSFAAHLQEADPDRAEHLLSPIGSWRPSVKGDWEEIVATGFVLGDASHYNPGFHREGDTRFEASVRVDTSRAKGAGIVALLGHVLDHLTENLAVSQLSDGCCNLRRLTRLPAFALAILGWR